MQIHNWIETVLNTKSKIRILRTLLRFKEREFTERELAKTTEMSVNTINIALRDLRRTNILNFKKIGRANSYRINSNSILYLILNELFEKENIEERLGEIIKKELNEKVVSCVIFGSFAVGKEEFDSDLDLLIISENNISKEIENLREQISIAFSTSISPIVLNLSEFNRRKKENFIENAIKNNIFICGRRLEEL